MFFQRRLVKGDVAEGFMELGLNFDDSDFTGELKETQIERLYEANICFPEWFLSDGADNGKNDRATLFKFRGDHHYHCKNYASSLKCYQESFACLSCNNKSMKRELMESIARCYINLEDYMSALEYSRQMMTDSVTMDNYCQVLMLLQKIYQHQNQYIDEVMVVQKLITVYRQNAHFWMRLSELYENIYKTLHHVTDLNQHSDAGVVGASCVQRTNIGIIQNFDRALNMEYQHRVLVNDSKHKERHSASFHFHMNDEVSSELSHMAKNYDDSELVTLENENLCAKCQSGNATPRTASKNDIDTSDVDIFTDCPYDLVQLICLLKIRMILNTGTSHGHGSFIEDKNALLMQQIERKLQALDVDGHKIIEVKQLMKEEICEEDNEGHDSEHTQTEDMKAAIDRITIQAFNDRWFSLIKRTCKQ